MRGPSRKGYCSHGGIKYELTREAITWWMVLKTKHSNFHHALSEDHLYQFVACEKMFSLLIKSNMEAGSVALSWQVTMSWLWDLTRGNHQIDTRIVRQKSVFAYCSSPTSQIKQTFGLVYQVCIVKIWHHILFDGFATDFDWLWWANTFANVKANK